MKCVLESLGGNSIKLDLINIYSHGLERKRRQRRDGGGVTPKETEGRMFWQEAMKNKPTSCSAPGPELPSATSRSPRALTEA